jgi:hypothetical protein
MLQHVIKTHRIVDLERDPCLRIRPHVIRMDRDTLGPVSPEPSHARSVVQDSFRLELSDPRPAYPADVFRSLTVAPQKVLVIVEVIGHGTILAARAGFRSAAPIAGFRSANTIFAGFAASE